MTLLPTDLYTAILFIAGVAVVTPLVWLAIRDFRNRRRNRRGEPTRTKRHRVSLIPKRLFRKLAKLYAEERLGYDVVEARPIAKGVWRLQTGDGEPAVYGIHRQKGELVSPEALARLYVESKGEAFVITNTDFDYAALRTWSGAPRLVLVNGSQLERSVGRHRLSRIILHDLPAAPQAGSVH